MKKSKPHSTKVKTIVSVMDDRSRKSTSRLAKNSSVVRMDTKTKNNYLSKIKCRDTYKGLADTASNSHSLKINSIDAKGASQLNQKLREENQQLKHKYHQLQESSLNDKEKIKALIVRISDLKQSRVSQTATVKQHPSNTIREHTSRQHPSNTIREHPTHPQLRQQPSNTQLKKYPQLLSLQNKSQNKSCYESPYHGIAMGLFPRQRQCQNEKCVDRKKYLQMELYQERVKRDTLEREKKDWDKKRTELTEQYKALLREVRLARDHDDEY